MFESTVNASSFRGFLIQARLAVDDMTVVGQFEEPPAGGDYQYGSCANREVFMHVYMQQFHIHSLELLVIPLTQI